MAPNRELCIQIKRMADELLSNIDDINSLLKIDTATNVIPGMKALKNAKKIGSKLGLLDKLKMFNKGGHLTVDERKEFRNTRRTFILQ
jgi:hypothetical protein